MREISTIIKVLVLVLVFVPIRGFTDVELTGTILKVDKAENRLVVKTHRGEETLLLDKNTKGLENAKQGAKVLIKFTEKDGEPKVIEIVPADEKMPNSPR